MAANQSHTIPIPAHLQTILDELLDLDTAASHVVQDLSDDQINWTPEPETWSVAQCLDHLARTNFIFINALRKAVNGSRYEEDESHPIRPRWLERLFLRTLEPPVRRKFRAPKRVTPTGRLHGEEVLSSYHRSHADLRQVLTGACRTDLNRIRLWNPFIPMMKLSAGVTCLVIAAHGRRHLWQAKMLRNLPQFPSSKQK